MEAIRAGSFSSMQCTFFSGLNGSPHAILCPVYLFPAVAVSAEQQNGKVYPTAKDLDPEVGVLSVVHVVLPEREREIYARRPCIVLQRGIVGRVPWCKDYKDPLPLLFCH